ncbi:autotransporter outer membrane beta-barrel domain-containing protein [Sutterella sp.]|uniref:autotransporter outer membrane beta-barrel domain-containing protein n=1 Tax=Sutterella sp. TaxID=1981025 RepID=UPI003FD758DB
MVNNEGVDNTLSAIIMERSGTIDIDAESFLIENKRTDRDNAGGISIVGDNNTFDVSLTKSFREKNVVFGILAKTNKIVTINADEGIDINTYFRDVASLSDYYDYNGAGVYLLSYKQSTAKTSASLKSNNGSITIKAQGYGYYGRGNVNSNIIAKSDVAISGKLNYAVYLIGNDDTTIENKLSVKSGRNILLSSDGERAVVLYGKEVENNTKLELTAENDISIVGGKYGIWSYFGDVTANSKSLSIDTNNNSYSLCVFNNSTVSATVDKITTIYDQVFVSGGKFILVSPESVFKDKIKSINNGTVSLNASSSFVASKNNDPSQQIMVADTNSSIQGVFGRSVIDGTISSTNGSLIDLSLSHGSIYTGATSNKVGTASEGSVNLKFEGSSTWRLSDNSSMSKLVLTDSSIAFGELQSDPMTHQYRNLKTKELVGSNGTLHMNIDLEKESTRNVTLDQLEVLDIASGSLKVGLAIQGEEFPENKPHSNNWLVAQGSGSNLAITNLSGGSTFSGRGMVTVWNLGFVKDGDEALLDTDEGRQQIGTQTNGNGQGKWYLVKAEHSQPDPVPNPNPNPPTPPVTPPLPPEVNDNITIGTSSGQAEAYQADMEDLRKRTGEVRYGAQDGGWISVFGKKDSVKASGTAGFKQEIYGLNIGVDRLVHADEDSAWLLGGAFRYSDADQKGLGSGYTTGTLQEYSGKLYATWMHNKGSYADFVLQAGRYVQELEGFDNTGMDKSKADYGTWGFGASVEVGHMFSLGGGVDDRRWFNHWFVEPQLQLSYFLAKGADYTTSTGLKVDQGNADFLTGRAGFVLGKKFNYGTIDDLDRRYYQVAVLGGVKHEFLGGDQTISYTGIDGAKASVRAGDIEGTRFYYGVNFDWQVTDNFRLYAQASREEGDRYTKDYDVSIGGKLLF